jgi:hypothetical protein
VATSVAAGLRLAHPDPTEQLSRERIWSGRERWRGWDDAGTQYGQGSSGGWGGHGLLLEDIILEPGPPDHARILTLRVDRLDHTQQLAVDLNPQATPA